jgi:hypothetical protein
MVWILVPTHYKCAGTGYGNTFANSQITGIDWLMNKGCKFIMGDANNAAMANTFNNNKQQAISCALNTHANTEIKINRNTFIGDANSGAVYISEASNSAATFNGSYNKLEITHNNIAVSRWGIRLDNVLGSQVFAPVYLTNQPLDDPKQVQLIDQKAVITGNTISYNAGLLVWSNQKSLPSEGIMGNNAQGITLIENKVQPMYYPAFKQTTRDANNAAMRFTHGRANMVYKNTLNGGEGIRNNFNALNANIFCNILDNYVNGFTFDRSSLRTSPPRGGATPISNINQTHGWSTLERHNNFSLIGGSRKDIFLTGTRTGLLSNITEPRSMQWWFGPVNSLQPYVSITGRPANVNQRKSIERGINWGVNRSCTRRDTSTGPKDIFDPWGGWLDTSAITFDTLVEYYNNWYDLYMQHIDAIHTGNAISSPDIYMQDMAQVEYYIVQDSLQLAGELIENIQTEDVYETNYKQVIGLWLDANYPVIRDFTTLEINTLKNIAVQNSLETGPAATMARIYLKMAIDTTIYEPTIEEGDYLGGLLYAEECNPYYFANAQINLVGPNFNLNNATIADSSGRFLIGPDVLGSIPANATFDLIITTYNGDVYPFNKIQNKAEWNMEPELLIHKNCASAALVGLSNEPQAKTVFTAYPIPVQNTLYVNGFNEANSYNLIILDVNGRMIMQQEVTHKQTMQLDIAGIKQGVYFIQIIDEQGIIKKLKFVK